MNKVLLKCSKCGEEKEAKCFCRDSRRHTGFSSWCKFCKKSNNKENYIKNTDKFKEKAIKWQKNNPEKTKIIKKRWLNKINGKNV